MRYTLALLLMLVAPAWAEVKVYPPADQAIGAVTSETVGRWIVFRAAPFGVVAAQTITLGGEPGCLWTGDAGTYTAVLVPTDTSAPIETGTVVLGGSPEPDPGPGPDPEPDPDPEPTPGPKRVVVVMEEDNQTAYREVAINVLRDYCLAEGHDWDLYDPDMEDENGQVAEAVAQIEAVGMPAILISDSVGNATVVRLPDAGRTAASAKAAGKKAVDLLKEAGG